MSAADWKEGAIYAELTANFTDPHEVDMPDDYFPVNDSTTRAGGIELARNSGDWRQTQITDDVIRCAVCRTETCWWHRPVGKKERPLCPWSPCYVWVEETT